MGEIDVVVGGPPCQGFSGLNRAKVGAERNSLWQEFVRIVREVQPKVFVIENVDRFVRSPEFADLKSRIGDGDLHNYQLVEPGGAGTAPGEEASARRYLLNAADFGAPQARRRAIVIGVRTDAGLPPSRFQYPAPTHRRTSLRGSMSAELQAGLPSWRASDIVFEETAGMPLNAHDLPDPKRRLVAGLEVELPGPFRTADLHFTRQPEEISRARYAAIPLRGGRKDLRGRYVCRFDDGEALIIEKVGEYRGPDGALRPLGAYSIVVNGEAGERRVDVRGSAGGRKVPRSGARRAVEESFRVIVNDGERARPAVIEYLSTPSWDRHNTGSGDVMGRLRMGDPSVTIRTEFFKPEKGRYLHPVANRPITHFEAAKLQGFPDDFLWYGSKTEIAKQIGNAVPIQLGTKIAESIFEYLRLGDPKVDLGEGHEIAMSASAR